jgi:tRNA A37 methylthiotransferase MiaB
MTLLEYVKYDLAFLFAYSMREKTSAHRKFVDDVPEDVKKRRLMEGIDSYRKNLDLITLNEVGRIHLMLVDGKSK